MCTRVHGCKIGHIPSAASHGPPSPSPAGVSKRISVRFVGVVSRELNVVKPLFDIVDGPVLGIQEDTSGVEL